MVFCQNILRTLILCVIWLAAVDPDDFSGVLSVDLQPGSVVEQAEGGGTHEGGDDDAALIEIDIGRMDVAVGVLHVDQAVSQTLETVIVVNDVPIALVD